MLVLPGVPIHRYFILRGQLAWNFLLGLCKVNWCTLRRSEFNSNCRMFTFCSCASSKSRCLACSNRCMCLHTTTVEVCVHHVCWRAAALRIEEAHLVLYMPSLLGEYTILPIHVSTWHALTLSLQSYNAPHSDSGLNLSGWK